MGSLPNYKEILDLFKKGANLEAQEKIMELRERALEFQEENLKLRQNILKLQAEISLEHSLNFDGDVYWKDMKGNKEGPFCPKCRDTRSKIVHLHSDGIGWYCYTCSLHFGPSDKY
ncbi:MAG: hypothetical protein KAI43_12830 [Candidatus Aureabacteria bacterium]|nr:hypothetical protein [Candidatus Auribacterota bacterium]